MKKEIKVLCEKNIQTREQELLDHLLTGWEISNSVYAGNDYVEYILTKEGK